KELVEYCEKAGWDLVCVLREILVFSSKEENPVPIETDTDMELKNLDNIMRSCNLQGYGYYIMMAAIYGGLMISRWKEAPFQELSSSMNLWLIGFIALALLISVDGIIYSRWMKKAMLYVREYDDFPSDSKSVLYRIAVDWSRELLILAYLIWGSVAEDMFFVVGAILGVVGFSLFWQRKKEKKRYSMLKGMVYKPRYGDVLLVLIVSSFLIWGGFILTSAEIIESEEKSLENAPVTLADIVEIEQYVNQYIDYETNESVFTKHISFYHDQDDHDEGLTLEYSYGKVKMDRVYDLARNTFFQQENIQLEEYEKMDAAIYGAKEAYKKVLSVEEYPRVEYVFIWDDAFAKVRFENIPTDEQVCTVAKKLENIE
ncbi:MAG: DUF2812 domain-containing protein, partial [Firmicutes bacterium]|nr:DUF2812 domain-containing protein [Bacillota bacterium]